MAEVERPNLWGREPTMILALIQAGIALAVGFGLPITNEQIGLLLGASAAMIGVVTRTQVYPSAMVEAKLTPLQKQKLEKPLNG